MRKKKLVDDNSIPATPDGSVVSIQIDDACLDTLDDLMKEIDGEDDEDEDESGDFDDDVLPPRYADYADPRVIDPAWSATTMDVVRTLERELNWRNLDLETKKDYFSSFAEIAACACEEDDGFGMADQWKSTWKYIYAVAYKLAWKLARKNQGDLVDIGDQVSAALNAVCDPKIIKRYNHEFAPSTFLTALIRTALSDAFYRQAPESKRIKLLRSDIRHFDELKEKFDPEHKCEKISTAMHYILLEMLRANPTGFRDIQMVLKGHRTGVEYNSDKLEIAMDAKAAEGEDSIELEDTDLFQVLQSVLSPEELEIFVRHYTSADPKTISKEPVKLDPDQARYGQIMAKLQRTPEVLEIYEKHSRGSRKKGLRTRRVKFDLGIEKIPEEVFEQIALGDIVDCLDDDR